MSIRRVIATSSQHRAQPSAMSRAGSRPVVVKEIPAVPWGAESYVGERIEIGFYEVAR